MCFWDRILKEEVGIAEVGCGLWVVVLSSSMLLGFVGSRRSPMFGSSIAGFLGCSNW